MFHKMTKPGTSKRGANCRLSSWTWRLLLCGVALGGLHAGGANLLAQYTPRPNTVPQTTGQGQLSSLPPTQLQLPSISAPPSGMMSPYGNLPAAGMPTAGANAPHMAPSPFTPGLPNGIPAPGGLQQAQGVEPPVVKQPEKVPGGAGPSPAADVLPQPRSSGPWAPWQVRTPLLSVDGLPVLGTTPTPDKATVAEFKKYVEKFIDPANTLDLIKSRIRLVVLKETPKRIQMGDESIAIYNLISPKEITMVGKATGSTVLNMWFVDDAGKEIVLSYLVRVFPDPEEKDRLERVYKALEMEVNRVFPDSVVHLRLVGDKVVVTGQAHDSIEAAQIVRIVRANSPGSEQNPQIPVSTLQPRFNPADPNYLQPGLENYGLHSTAQVINMLRIPGEQQVMLKVIVAEVNRTAARSIGLNFTAKNNAGIQYLANFTGNIGAGNIPVLLDNGQISLAISALKSQNYARSLAEPNLVTLNGMPANFQAGGQFPVPIVTGATAVGLQGTTFVPFGVQLNFTPYITDKDRVRLAVNANVSTRDTATGANIGGSSVPGLTTRNFATTVELREGQTMAVAGLIQNNIDGARTNVPFFAEIPGINRLTGLDKVSHGEQELVILVTPELVHPMEPKEVPPLPGSDLFEPSDCEFYLYGLLESRRTYDYRSSVMNDLARKRRYHQCEQLYIFGPTGHTGAEVGPGPGAGPGMSGPGCAPGQPCFNQK